MFTIKENKNEEIIIKNSKFISYLFYVQNETEIQNKIKEISLKHKDYTHLIYAYKLKDKQKSIDDGEPTGTAGIPVLEIINKNNLVNVLIIIIRYFGGIKLGAGGLIRAYSKAARILINENNLKEYIKYNYYELKTNYENKKLLTNLTNNLDIIKKDFNKEIIYTIKIKEELDNIEQLFKDTKIKSKKLNL